VVLLGSVHDGAGEGLYLSDSQYFETPLGNLTVDQNLGAELASCSTLFEINDIPHLREHSLEVLLPFVRFCFPGARIIPLLMGVPRPSLVSALARALRIVFEPLLENTLFVISANLSKNHDGDLSRRQAEECIRLLQENDLPGFNAGIYNGALSICSGAMAAALLESGLLRGASPRLVSGPLVQTRADNDMIVHYGGLVF
jgi:AmmeMemoRadiSam system protein B